MKLLRSEFKQLEAWSFRIESLWWGIRDGVLEDTVIIES